MKATVTCLTNYRAEKARLSGLAAATGLSVSDVIFIEETLRADLAAVLASGPTAVFSDGGPLRTMSLEQAAAEFGVTGYTEIGGLLKAELQGQPIFEGWCGPMWGSDDAPLRYESWASYRALSV